MLSDDQLQPPMSPFSTLSTTWQRAIERKVFRHMRLLPSDLETFAHLAVGRRRTYVRDIDMGFGQEPYDIANFTQVETEDEQNRKDSIFTATIQRLFQILSGWGNNHPGLRLNLPSRFPPNNIPTMNRDAFAYVRKETLKSQPCGRKTPQRRYRKLYLSLVDLINIPEVQVITKLYIPYTAPSRLWPGSAASIAALLPNLKEFWADLWDSETSDLESRRRSRKGGWHSMDTWTLFLSC